MTQKSTSGPKIWNRETQSYFHEKVFGGEVIDFLYTNTLGKTLERLLTHTPLPSRLYGHYQDSNLSCKQIPPFIKKFDIDMSEYENTIYRSFNDFFIRKFKPGLREFSKNKTELSAPCEARYTFFESLNSTHTIHIKNSLLSSFELLQKPELAKLFADGPAAICRLCPVDYHRFHFPDAGETLDSYRIHGELHSVNPKAFAIYPNLFFKNERHVSLLKTENFGHIAYVEVGALCVGKIIQSHKPSNPYQRGDEKGYFLFGGSTVIVLGEKNAWRWENDLLERSRMGDEIYIKLGSTIGHRP